MNLIIGIITVIGCTFGGYILQGGHIHVLLEAAPLELVIMGGTVAGGFVIANPPSVIKRTLKSLGLLLKKPKYNKASYIELLCMMYQMFKLAKTKGLLALEKHIENPHESAIFGQFPGFQHNHHATDFFCDYLRLVTLGADKPYELDALMDETEKSDQDNRAAIDRKLLEILVCPLTKGPLEYDARRQELISRSAKLAYPIRDGVPIMLPEEARPIEG